MPVSEVLYMKSNNTQRDILSKWKDRIELQNKFYKNGNSLRFYNKKICKYFQLDNLKPQIKIIS